ncbi:MAG: DinB family protein [Saprospiraceae bacterium]|jgi:hypothetical protein|nr:DinB family protein [Saprospiraceae bacterium]
MVSNEITALLKSNENAIRQLFKTQEPNFWEVQPEGKWSAGQHVIHLVQSTKPLLNALRLPDFVLKWRFGTSNRPSRNFEDVVARYEEKLSKVAPGIVGPFSRNMPDSPAIEADTYLNQLQEINEKLNKATLKLSDKQLDTLLLPHPLMGKMTLREILMWNAYHTMHHISVLKEKYLNK